MTNRWAGDRFGMLKRLIIQQKPGNWAGNFGPVHSLYYP